MLRPYALDIFPDTRAMSCSTIATFCGDEYCCINPNASSYFSSAAEYCPCCLWTLSAFAA
jgi:hypothetical protein